MTNWSDLRDKWRLSTPAQCMYSVVSNWLAKDQKIASAEELVLLMAFGIFSAKLLPMASDKRLGENPEALTCLLNAVKQKIPEAWFPLTTLNLGCDSLVLSSNALPSRVLKIGFLRSISLNAWHSFYTMCASGSNQLLPTVDAWHVDKLLQWHFCVQESLSSYDSIPSYDQPSAYAEDVMISRFETWAGKKDTPANPLWYSDILGAFGFSWEERLHIIEAVEPFAVAHSLESEVLYRDASSILKMLDAHVNAEGCFIDLCPKNVGFTETKPFIIFDPLH